MGGLTRGFLREAWYPSIESYIKEGNFVIHAELPGIDPKDVDISVVGDQLTIKGERKASKEAKREDYLLSEVHYGSFERTLTLPEGVRADNIRANYKNGILEVTLPAEKAALPRKVTVEVEGAREELKKAGDSIKEKQMDKLKEGIAESINEKETTDKKENGTIAKLDITGSWSVEKGPYQKIIIFEDGSYSAFLNDKPLIEGNWYFIDGVFALVAKQNPELSEGFSAITKNGDTLTLQTNEGTLTWKKIEQE